MQMPVDLPEVNVDGPSPDMMVIYDDTIIRNSKLEYEIDIYIGSNEQLETLALDTSTNIMIIPTVNCRFCGRLNLFDCTKSTTCKPASGEFTYTHSSLFDAWVDDSLTGALLLDEVCLGKNKTNCVSQYTFFGTKDDPDVGVSDGVMGLRPSAKAGDPV